MEDSDVTIKVFLQGFSEAEAKAKELAAAIEAAKSLAGDLADLLSTLSLKVDV